MSCLAIIRAARDKMSANEKKLADFVLDNAPLIRDYLSQQIAAAVEQVSVKSDRFPPTSRL